ncbi:MAG: hypothetical protein D6737_00510 [Chloroflexi bacterium]|nr:MAG: hypothetical protein CUN54_02820 [Phototrophicales bacterium]RMF82848.1 MAG: hypothetical protein D6737_00510 [Chloroflexota bacterium]
MQQNSSLTSRSSVNTRRWVAGFLIVMAAMIDGIFLILGLSDDISAALAIGLIGLTTFFSVIIAFNIVTTSPGYEAGEIRKSIGVSVVVTYLVTLPLLLIDSQVDPVVRDSVLDSLTAVTAVTIGFYFGSRILHQIVSAWRSTRYEQHSHVANSNATQHTAQNMQHERPPVSNFPG